MHDGKYCDAAKRNALKSLDSDIDPQTGLPWVSAFEETFAKISGDSYAIAVNSGTSALHAALLAFGVGPGDEVISPALTVIMDAFATCYVGAVPVFADVDPSTWNIDPKMVESLITEKTKAIISVSWLGLPSNLVELKKLALKHNLYLLDDSAETLLIGDYQPNPESKPDMRMFSFESKKHMSTGGEGGMLTTDSESLAKLARQAAGLGYKHLTAGRGRTSLASRVFQNPGYERFDAIGFNYRMTPTTAAIGLGQLENLEFLLNSRISVAQEFLKVIKDISWLTPQPIHSNGIPHAYYSFAVKIDYSEKIDLSWQAFYDDFTSRGGDGFYANCKNPYLEPYFFGKKLGNQKFELGLCPAAEKLQTEIISFKTNYLDKAKVVEQCELLSQTIERFN
jgi:perosamine synthetase